MNLSLSLALRNEIVNRTTERLTELEVYSAPRPASADAPATGTKLATFPIAMSGSVGGVTWLEVPTRGTVLDTGVAAWARWGGTPMGMGMGMGESVAIDGDVGTTGAVFNLSTLNVEKDSPLMLVSLRLSQPAI